MGATHGQTSADLPPASSSPAGDYLPDVRSQSRRVRALPDLPPVRASVVAEGAGIRADPLSSVQVALLEQASTKRRKGRKVEGEEAMIDSQDSRREFSDASVILYNADTLGLYLKWPSPIVIVSDGAYGVRGFPGDPPTPAGLADWYEPHIAEWSKYSTPQTTLWFWNTELGWATVHPVLVANGWEYRCCNIWDKGLRSEER